MADDYSGFNKEERILRDCLALDRTIMANERTLLSYIRLFVGFIAAGAGMVKVFPNSCFYTAMGIIFSAASWLFLIIGLYRWHSMKNKLATVANNKNDMSNKKEQETKS